MTSNPHDIRPKQHWPHLPALTGIRFVAILHIFCFHLWVLFDMKKEPGMENLLRGMNDLPAPLFTAIANGWMSTSFFFLLSGFILAYLYWGEDGQLSIPKKTFWLARAIRIYPIHLILMLITLLMTTAYQLSLGTSPWLLVASGLTTLTLTQAWYPDFVPIWSWPTWTISALVFLYATLVCTAVYFATAYQYLRVVFSRWHRGTTILENFYWFYSAILVSAFYCRYFVNQSI
jgi:peptidoglycan/LPS O-acetylase OafA/YrhL